MEQMDEELDEDVSEWRRLKESLVVNKRLISLKFTMLLVYGACSLYLPYLTLHMVQIGLSIEEIAIIYAVLPFVTSIAPPLAGLLADKFNNYKFFLIFLIVSSAVFHTLLLYVDATIPADVDPLMPDNVSAQLFCSGQGANLRFDNYTCNQELSLEDWSANFVPSKCRPMTSYSTEQSLLMSLCYVKGQDNCTEIDITSQFELKMDFLFQIDENDENCTAWIVDVQVDEVPNSPSSLNCSSPIQCPMTVKLPPNDDVINASLSNTLKHKHGFGNYFLIRIMASSSLAAAFSMLDATAICMVKNCQGDLGKQRLFGVIGQAVFAMIAGIILDWTVQIKGEPDYSTVFYLADIFFAIVIVFIIRLDVDVERVEASSLASSCRSLCRLVDLNVFMVMMLLLGSCWGFLESFLFIFLIELKASSYLLGMTVTLGCVIGIPFLYISDTIVRKIGSVNVIVIAFLLYSVRFFGYSLIWESWLCLPFEALEAVTVHMMAVASSTYCAAAAPPGALATLNGVVGSVHYSFGRGVGSFIGGILMVTYGTRFAFKIFGTGALICGLFYFVLHRLYLVELEKTRLRRKSEHIAEVIASGAEIDDDESNNQFLIPPDNLMGRRMSCF